MDAKNIFDSIDRPHLLQEVLSTFPDIYSNVKQMYSQAGRLVFTTANSQNIILSEVGVHQDDPLGPTLFSLAIYPFLSKLQSSDSDVIVLAYLDNAFLLNPPRKLISTFNSLKQSFTGIGLTIACNRCEFYSKDTVTSTQIPELLGIPIKSNGTMILGIPFGQLDFQLSSCNNFAQKESFLCNWLEELEDVQCAALLFRSCHVPRLNHLARMIAPDILKSAATTLYLMQCGGKHAFQSGLVALA